MYATSTQWNEDTKYFSATIRCYCSRNMIVRCGPVQGLKYLKNCQLHTKKDDGGAEGLERGTEARSAGVPMGWGLRRGAVAPPQYGGLGALPPENFEI